MLRDLIVTGGTGYIGTRLVEQALAQGRGVTLLGRRPGPAGTRHLPWTLGEPLPQEPTAAQQALVHLAHDWRRGDAENVDGTARLFESAAGVGQRVFVSSQSARERALNRYGRMKWASEQRVGAAVSLRVGLVYGGPRSAMYGLLCKLARLPILPMIEPNRTVQPIHLDEVVDGILAAADGQFSGPLALAGPEQVRFGDVLRLLATRFGGRKLPIIPVPLRAALLACDISARLPLIPTVDRERVLGLAGTEPLPAAADLAQLGVVVRPMAEALAADPAGRRALRAEAQAFLRHAGVTPSSALLRRYARTVPEGALARPRLPLRLVEPVAGTGELARRLRIAARLAEASAVGEARLARGRQATRLAALALGGAAEAALLPARLALGTRK